MLRLYRRLRRSWTRSHSDYRSSVVSNIGPGAHQDPRTGTNNDAGT